MPWITSSLTDVSIFIVTEQGAFTLTGGAVDLDFQCEGDTYATLRVDDGATELPIAAMEVVRADSIDTLDVKEPSNVWQDKLGIEYTFDRELIALPREAKGP